MASSTDLPPGNIVSALQKFGHSPDFSEADFTFQMKGNNGLTLRMTQPVLRSVISSLTETLQYLESRRRTKTGHIAVLALEMTEASAFAAAGGEKILIRLKGTNRIEYGYSLSRASAARLSAELSQALQSADEQAKQTRQ